MSKNSPSRKRRERKKRQGKIKPRGVKQDPWGIQTPKLNPMATRFLFSQIINQSE